MAYLASRITANLAISLIFLTCLVFLVLPVAAHRDGAANSTETFRARRLAGDADDRNFRPGQGTGHPDVVSVGVMIRKFYGINVKAGSFSADIILTLRWKDDRVKKHIPQGSTSVTLDKAAATALIWTPDVVPTNREIHGLEDISVATTLFDNGDVQRTRRILAILKNNFDVSGYPFDHQNLEVLLASSKYMFEDVVLDVIEKKYWGIPEGSFGSAGVWSAGDSQMTTFEDIMGSLHKSRGRFQMEVFRKSRTIVEGSVFPEMLLLGMVYAIFYLPLSVPFVMPRVAVGIIGYLTMASFASRTAAELPPTGAITWMGLWEGACSSLMFGDIVFNILAEYVCHTVVNPEGKPGNPQLALEARERLATFWGLSHIFILLAVFCTPASGNVVSMMIIRVYVILSIFGGCAWALVSARQARTIAEEAAKAATPEVELADRAAPLIGSASSQGADKDAGPPVFNKGPPPE